MSQTKRLGFLIATVAMSEEGYGIYSCHGQMVMIAEELDFLASSFLCLVSIYRLLLFSIQMARVTERVMLVRRARL